MTDRNPSPHFGAHYQPLPPTPPQPTGGPGGISSTTSPMFTYGYPPPPPYYHPHHYGPQVSVPPGLPFLQLPPGGPVAMPPPVRPMRMMAEMGGRPMGMGSVDAHGHPSHGGGHQQEIVYVPNGYVVNLYEEGGYNQSGQGLMPPPPPHNPHPHPPSHRPAPPPTTAPHSKPPKKPSLTTTITGSPRIAKRPANSWILYRQEKHPIVLATHAGITNNEISKVVAEWWRNEPEEVKNVYKMRAEEERRKHRLLFPGYKYAPRKNKPKRKKRDDGGQSQSQQPKREESHDGERHADDDDDGNHNKNDMDPEKNTEKKKSKEKEKKKPIRKAHARIITTSPSTSSHLISGYTPQGAAPAALVTPSGPIFDNREELRRGSFGEFYRLIDNENESGNDDGKGLQQQQQQQGGHQASDLFTGSEFTFAALGFPEEEWERR